MSLCHLKTDPDLRHGYKAKHGVAEEPEFRRPPEIETLRAWSQLVVPDGPNRGKTFSQVGPKWLAQTRNRRMTAGWCQSLRQYLLFIEDKQKKVAMAAAVTTDGTEPTKKTVSAETVTARTEPAKEIISVETEEVAALLHLQHPRPRSPSRSRSKPESLSKGVG